MKKGTKHTEESRMKMSESRKGKNLGKIVSNETKLKISLANKGHKLSDETRRKIGLIHKGKIMSEESRRKMSESHKKIKFSEEHKNNISISRKGMKFSDKHKKKLSDSHKGKPSGMKGKIGIFKHTEEQKIKIGNSNKGKHNKILSEETKNKIKVARSKQVLPVKDTSIEVKIQNFLKELCVEFFTHKYMNIEHAYQCDIFIPSINTVIECDGNYFHKYPTGKDIDHVRTKELIEKGFKVLRLWEIEIKEMGLDKFKEKLYEVTVK
ncbi:MAG: NUMOD3 domain-containing DNA-binding protein [archaeon]|nr:NUMOD3 domain-containing DNA-binding protein [archaeon]